MSSAVVSHLTEGIRRIVTVDCPHSTTTVTFCRGSDDSVDFTDQQLVHIACVRALVETPCPCVSALLIESAHVN